MSCITVELFVFVILFSKQSTKPHAQNNKLMTMAASHQVISSSVSCSWTKEPGKRDVKLWGEPQFPSLVPELGIARGKETHPLYIHLNNNIWRRNDASNRIKVIFLRITSQVGHKTWRLITLKLAARKKNSSENFMSPWKLKTLSSFCRCTTGNCLVQVLRAGASSFPERHMQDVPVSPLQWTKRIGIQTNLTAIERSNNPPRWQSLHSILLRSQELA